MEELEVLPSVLHTFLFTAPYSGMNAFYPGRRCSSPITTLKTPPYLYSAGWLPNTIIQFWSSIVGGGGRNHLSSSYKTTQYCHYRIYLGFSSRFLICFTVGSHTLISHLCDLCTQLQNHFFAFILWCKIFWLQFQFNSTLQPCHYDICVQVFLFGYFWFLKSKNLVLFM